MTNFDYVLSTMDTKEPKYITKTYLDENIPKPAPVDSLHIIEIIDNTSKKTVYMLTEGEDLHSNLCVDEIVGSYVVDAVHESNSLYIKGLYRLTGDKLYNAKESSECFDNAYNYAVKSDEMAVLKHSSGFDIFVSMYDMDGAVTKRWERVLSGEYFSHLNSEGIHETGFMNAEDLDIVFCVVAEQVFLLDKESGELISREVFNDLITDYYYSDSGCIIVTIKSGEMYVIDVNTKVYKFLEKNMSDTSAYDKVGAFPASIKLSAYCNGKYACIAENTDYIDIYENVDNTDYPAIKKLIEDGGSPDTFYTPEELYDKTARLFGMADSIN